MPLFAWDERFSVGDAMMDTQHMQWIRYINELYDAIREGKGDEEQTEILDNIIIYTQYHFASEERFLKRIEYSGLEAHHEIHQRMAERARSLQKDIRAGRGDLCLDLITLLRTWLVDHIMDEDKKYAAYIAEHLKNVRVLVR